jgi:hypothetical protein
MILTEISQKLEDWKWIRCLIVYLDWIRNLVSEFISVDDFSIIRDPVFDLVYLEVDLGCDYVCHDDK